MKTLATAVACCLALAVTGPAPAADKDAKTNKDKIVGVWEVTKGVNAPVGATAEFTKDGKMIVTFKDDDGKVEKIEGTYTIDKDSITSSLKVENEVKNYTAKIKKLTDKELVVEGEKGQTDEFKRK